MSAAAVDGHWVEIGAPARQEHSLVYDAMNHRLVLFGGTSHAASNAVYVLDLGTQQWSRLEPAGVPPSARHGHVAIYDAIRQRMLVFGGYDGARRNDVWALSLDAAPAWTELAPAGAPPPARFRMAGGYDAIRDRLLVHGGDGEAGALDDVWALSLAGGESWAELVPAGPAAPARAQHAGACDPVRDRLLVFGGAGDASGLTWAFDLATQTWDSLQTIGGPPAPRTSAAGIYDPLHDAFLVIGGYAGPLTFADTWALSLSGTPSWSQKNSPGRRGAAACWIPALSGAAVHGGYDYSFTHTSTVLLDPGQYSDVTTLNRGGPWLRRGSEGIFDPARRRLVIYGGDAASGFDTNPTDETWSMAADPDYGWANLWPYGPYHRMHHTLIHDPADDRMILYAGDGVYGVDTWLDDTWSFDLATDTWTELAFAGPIPGSHRLHTSIYDPVGHRMIVFGGIVEGSYSNALWQLDLSGQPNWSPVAATGVAPAPRAGHVAVYDPDRHRMLVFDGSGPFTWPPWPTSFNDLWELTLSGQPEWRQLSPLGTSPGGEHGAVWRAVHDPGRHRILVFGGSSIAAQYQLVLTDPPEWAPLLTTGPAPNRVPGQPVVYDAAADRLLVFGAGNSDATLALELEPVGTVSIPRPAAPARFAVSRVAPNPARATLAVTLDLPRAGEVSIQLIDVAGRRVATRAAVLAAGRQEVSLRVPRDAAPGVYFLRALCAGEAALSKVVVTR